MKHWGFFLLSCFYFSLQAMQLTKKDSGCDTAQLVAESKKIDNNKLAELLVARVLEYTSCLSGYTLDMEKLNECACLIKEDGFSEDQKKYLLDSFPKKIIIGNKIIWFV